MITKKKKKKQSTFLRQGRSEFGRRGTRRSQTRGRGLGRRKKRENEVKYLQLKL